MFVEIWMFVRLFVRLLDGCFWCELGVTVNKDGTQSVKGGFPLKMLTLLSGRNTMLLLNAARMQLLMVMI